jgi:hypothetical protein
VRLNFLRDTQYRASMDSRMESGHKYILARAVVRDCLSGNMSSTGGQGDLMNTRLLLGLGSVTRTRILATASISTVTAIQIIGSGWQIKPLPGRGHV